MLDVIDLKCGTNVFEHEDCYKSFLFVSPFRKRLAYYTSALHPIVKITPLYWLNVLLNGRLNALLESIRRSIIATAMDSFRDVYR